MRLRTILTLTSTERRLLVLAVPTVLAVRLALWVLPSPLVLRLSGALDESRGAVPPCTSPLVSRVAWAVQVVATRVPRATCLTQCLSALLLLRIHGETARLCLGVARSGNGEFRAHAWLERGGIALLGGAEARSMVRLPDLSHARARRASSRSA